jgi:short-subunit dehydrogenase
MTTPARRPTILLITGATAGIGRNTALALARKGHRVFATGRRESALATLQEEARGTFLETIPLDVTSAESIANVAAEIERRTDGYGLDVLVNNAGYGQYGPVEGLSDAELRAQFDTNVFGLLAVTRAFLPKMRERGAGRIINVSSVGGRVTFPLGGAYAATKYAVESLSDALRNEVAAFGVRVSVIEPGAIRSEFNERALATLDPQAAASGPYAPLLAQAGDLVKRIDGMAVGPEPVIRDIEHAAFSRRPRARYVSPFHARVIIAVFALLPTSLADWLVQTTFGVRRLLGKRAALGA